MLQHQLNSPYEHVIKRYSVQYPQRSICHLVAVVQPESFGSVRCFALFEMGFQARLTNPYFFRRLSHCLTIFLNKIDRVLSEQKIGLSGIVDPSTAADIGRILGVEYVVFGSITSATRKDIDKFGYMLVRIEVGIDVRAVNTTTARILLSESAVGRVDNKEVRTADGTLVSGAIDYDAAYAGAARKAVNEAGEKIANLSPLIGIVVKVSGAQTWIDVGEDQGVAVGDLFVVFRAGDEILHPTTGKRLGWDKEILQEVRVVTTESNMAVTEEVRSESDKPLIRGDLVISR